MELCVASLLIIPALALLVAAYAFNAVRALAEYTVAVLKEHHA